MGLGIGHQQVALVTELGDSIGDRVVEASIERTELVDLDNRIKLEGQVRYGLAKIAVVVNDLLDGKAMQ